MTYGIWTPSESCQAMVLNGARPTDALMPVRLDRQAKLYIVERTKQKLTLRLGIDDEAVGMKEEKIETKMFDSRKLGGFSQRQANLFDVGGYVSGLEWCPMSETESSSE
jgi:hypothetical protein